MKRSSVPASQEWGLGNEVAVFGYLGLCLSALGLGYLAAVSPDAYNTLAKEDHWVESLTAVLFFLAGILLLATALAERSLLRRCIYALGAAALVFAAGEEISWGQRIFGLATPDFLLEANAQQELNVHNISTNTFGQIYNEATLLLCIISGVAFFCGKDRLGGIPLPSILLVLGFLLVSGYRPLYEEGVLSHIVSRESVAFLICVYALLSSRTKLLMAAVAILAVVLIYQYVIYHSAVIEDRLYEVREYLFSFACLCYAGELLLGQRRFDALPFRWLRLPGFRANADKRNARRFDKNVGKSAGFGRHEFLRLHWSAVCAVIIAGGIALAVMGYVNAESRKAAYWAVKSGQAGKAAARSYFDIYLNENGLIYFKESCGPEDTAARFFLHVIPADVNDLPDDRKQYGFDNFDFDYHNDKRGLIFNEACIAATALPEYAITDIRTGQYIPGEGRIWRAEFPLPQQ